MNKTTDFKEKKKVQFLQMPDQAPSLLMKVLGSQDMSELSDDTVSITSS